MFFFLLSITILLLAGQTLSWLSILLIPISFIFLKKPLYLVPLLFISSLSKGYFFVFPGLSAISYYSFIFILSFLFSSNNRNLRYTNRFFIFIGIFIVFNIISCFTSLSGELFPCYPIVLSALLVYCMRYTKGINTAELAKLLFLAASITGIFVFLKLSLFPQEYVTRLGIINREGRMSIAGNVNPNTAASMLAQIISVLSGILFIHRKSNLFTIVIIFFCFLSIFFTGSRTAIFSIILSILISIAFFYDGVSIKQRIYVFVILIMFSFIIILVIERINLPFIDRYSLSDVLETQGSGRLTSWEVIFTKIIPQHLWLGVGLGGLNVSIALADLTGVSQFDADSMYVGLLAQVGVVGFIIYMFYFLRMFISFLNLRDSNPYLIIPIIMMLTGFFAGIGEDVHLANYFWISIGLGLIFAHNTDVGNLNYATKSEQR